MGADGWVIGSQIAVAVTALLAAGAALHIGAKDRANAQAIADAANSAADRRAQILYDLETYALLRVALAKENGSSDADAELIVRAAALAEGLPKDILDDVEVLRIMDRLKAKDHHVNALGAIDREMKRLRNELRQVKGL